MIDDMTRDELEAAIICERELYNQFDEQKFLDQGYTHQELLDIARAWIEAGSEV